GAQPAHRDPVDAVVGAQAHLQIEAQGRGQARRKRDRCRQRAEAQEEVARMTQADPTPTAQRYCPSCGAVYPADYAVCPRDATPLSRGEGGEDPLIGKILGDSYELSRRLGEGGMGRVY